MSSIAKGGRLPDGGVTRSDRRYVKEWRDFGRCICSALSIGGLDGVACRGFDPGVLLSVPSWNGMAPTLTSLDSELAKALARIGGWKGEVKP